MSKEDLTPEILADYIVEAMLEHKACDIVKIDLRKIENPITDFFIICHGNSNTHVNAISDNVERDVRKKCKDRPWKVEGKDNSEWVLMDYVKVVCHVFQRPVREFYNLEDLWSDGEVTRYEESVTDSF